MKNPIPVLEKLTVSLCFGAQLPLRIHFTTGFQDSPVQLPKRPSGIQQHLGDVVRRRHPGQPEPQVSQGGSKPLELSKTLSWGGGQSCSVIHHGSSKKRACDNGVQNNAKHLCRFCQAESW